MSAFYIGQRVRIVWVAAGWEQYLGAETTIVDRAPAEANASDWALAITSKRGRRVCAASRNLEPVIPPGLESLAEINALYEPEPITESAPTQRIADEVSLALETIALTGRRV